MTIILECALILSAEILKSEGIFLSDKAGKDQS